MCVRGVHFVWVSTLLLCPPSLQTPQARLLLGGGVRLLVSVTGSVGVGSGRAGVPDVLELGLETSGKGQVMLSLPSEQNC